MAKNNLNIGAGELAWTGLAKAYEIADGTYSLMSCILSIAGIALSPEFDMSTLDESNEQVAAWNAQDDKTKLERVKTYLKDMNAKPVKGGDAKEAGTTTATPPATEGQIADNSDAPVTVTLPQSAVAGAASAGKDDEIKQLKAKLQATENRLAHVEGERDQAQDEAGRLRDQIEADAAGADSEAGEDTKIGARLARVEKMLGMHR